MKKLFVTLYVCSLLCVLGIQFGTGKILGGIYKVFPQYFYNLVENEIESDRKLAMGTFYFINRELEEHPREKWNEVVHALQPYFGYPLKLLTLDKLLINNEAIDNAEKGEIVTNRIFSSEDYMYKKIGSSDLYLSMGPFPVSNNKTLAVIIWTVICLILAIPILIWSYLLWRDLSKISLATALLGKGDFSSRVKISRISSFRYLSETFNSMAGRIEKLIRSHKDLTNAVSHELRTPLARIKFGMEMLKNSKVESDIKRHRTGIEHDVNEIESLIDELLIYARFDREPEKTDLVLDTILPWFEFIIEKEKENLNDIVLSSNVLPDMQNCMVRFNHKYMTWVLKNLIRNAVKYAYARIVVTLEQEDGCCVIHVDDDGPGIPREKRDEIFKPFVMIDSSRFKKSGGYGLGLSIVSKIIKWHGGSYHVSDSVMNGARFTVSWPLS